jgi:FlaG/FlaF family flagellin (archaellin)
MINTLKEQLKRFVGDERAVSPVVGFVLIFALIMIVFTLYQSSVVPAQNEEAEFKHTQTVEGQMSKLNDAIQQAGTSGVPQSATIATGVQYPDRALAINPGSPAGTLETIDAPDVTLSGLSDGSGYWSDGETFETHLVSYQPSYNILQQEATYSLENGMFVKNFESGNTLLKSNGSVISDDGKRINLVLVGGDYQKSQMTTSATVRPVSTSTEYLSLNATGSNRSITVPTTLSENRWKELLNGKQYVSLEDHSPAGKFNKTVLGLDKRRTYNIRITKVTLGNSGSPELAYLTSEDERLDRTAAVGTPETFTVSARDEFGNAYSGALVDARTTGAGNFTRNETGVKDVATGDDGRATFTYIPGEDDAGTTTSVTFELDNDTIGTDRRNVSYNVTVPPETDGGANSSNESSLGFGEITNGYDVGVIVSDVEDAGGGSGSTITFKNIGNGTATATDVRISGFSVQGQVESGENITFSGKEIPFNANEVPLGNASFDVPDDGDSDDNDDVASVDVGSIGSQGGFLILDIRFDRDGETEAGTYAVNIPG